MPGFLGHPLPLRPLPAPPLTIIAIIGERDEPVPDLDPYRDVKRTEIATTRAGRAPEAGARASGGPGIRASPLAKKLARDRGVDLSTIAGSGPAGRITKEDVIRAAEAGVGEERIVPLSPSRARIAATVSRSFSTIPHIYITQEIDMGRARAVREGSRDSGAISYDALFLKGVALSMRDFPSFNGTMEGDRVRLSSRLNVGFLVETDDGIVVPTVRDVDRKSLVQITEEITLLAERARGRRLPAGAMSGSNFTVSNLGMHGILSFSAIVYPPQIGILAIGSIREVPCVVDGEVVPGWRAVATLSCDHRAVDGAQAARFLNAIKGRLEDPASMDSG